VNRLESALRQLVADLDAAGAHWAIVGGLAVSARAEPRTTRDVDAAVAVDSDAAAEQLVHILSAAGYRVRSVVEHATAGRLATARLVRPPGTAPVVDLLFASSGIEGEVVAHAQRLEILPSLIVPVASVGHLLALKVLARDDRSRPQDWDDIRALLGVATAADLDAARAAVALIEARGYARGRPLPQQLEAAVVEHRG